MAARLEFVYNFCVYLLVVLFPFFWRWGFGVGEPTWVYQVRRRLFCVMSGNAYTLCVRELIRWE